MFYGYTSDIKPQCEPEEITMITGSTAAFGFAVSPAGETYWFARVPDEKPLRPTEIAATTSAQWRDLLVRLLRKDHTPAADIVAKTKQELLVTNARDLPGLDRWRTERMIVIGDAAHAASPATGQGASMAIEDAVVLAKALRDTGDFAAGLALYEEIRRPRVSQNIANSARMTVSKMPGREQRAQNNQADRATRIRPVAAGPQRRTGPPTGLADAAWSECDARPERREPGPAIGPGSLCAVEFPLPALVVADLHAVVFRARYPVTCAPCWAALCSGIRTRTLPAAFPGEVTDCPSAAGCARFRDNYLLHSSVQQVDFPVGLLDAYVEVAQFAGDLVGLAAQFGDR